MNAPQERRTRQRIVTLQEGQPRFWLLRAGERAQLQDLSLEGFAVCVSTPPRSDEAFDFVIEHEGEPGTVKGRAQVVNFISRPGGGLAGCRFVELYEEGGTVLASWLAGHVIACSALPLREEDATRIVTGPSIV